MRRHNRACGEKKRMRRRSGAPRGRRRRGGTGPRRRDRHFVKSLLLVSPAVSHGLYTRTLPTVTLTRSESRSLSRRVRSTPDDPRAIVRRGRESLAGGAGALVDFCPISMHRVAESFTDAISTASRGPRPAILRLMRFDVGIPSDIARDELRSGYLPRSSPIRGPGR